MCVSGKGRWAGLTEALGWPQTMQGRVGPGPPQLRKERGSLWLRGLDEGKGRIGRPGGWESGPDWSRAFSGGCADADTLTEPRSHLAAWGPALFHRCVWSGSQSILKKGKSGCRYLRLRICASQAWRYVPVSPRPTSSQPGKFCSLKNPPLETPRPG